MLLVFYPSLVNCKISKQLQTETIKAQFQQLSTVLVSDYWNYLKHMQLKMTFCISQDSAATLFRWGRRVYNFLMWNFLGILYTKNYENRPILAGLFKIYKWGRFFESQCITFLRTVSTQETESHLESERNAAQEAHETSTTLERKLIAAQTELDDLRSLLEAVSRFFGVGVIAVVILKSGNGIFCGSVAQWLGRWTCDWRSRVQSQPLHCRVQPWTSCSHTLSSASGVTTLWHDI